MNKRQGYGKKTKRSVLTLVITIVIVLVTVTGSIIMVSAGGKAPVYTLSADTSTFTIESMYGLTIDTSAIESVELKPVLPDDLKRTNGYGGAGTIVKGHCSSSIGDVLVFVDTSKSLFLYITTSPEAIILNGENDAQTRQLYDRLNAALE